jgi:hypothetical protein
MYISHQSNYRAAWQVESKEKYLCGLSLFYAGFIVRDTSVYLLCKSSIVFTINSNF